MIEEDDLLWNRLKDCWVGREFLLDETKYIVIKDLKHSLICTVIYNDHVCAVDAPFSKASFEDAYRKNTLRRLK